MSEGDAKREERAKVELRTPLRNNKTPDILDFENQPHPNEYEDNTLQKDHR